MLLTDEQSQILFDGVRGTAIDFEDAVHGRCTVVRGKSGYTLTVENRGRIGPLSLKTEDTQSLTEESE